MTNLRNAVSKMVGYFGMKLKWTQFQRAEFVERMYLLVGVALLLWTSVGRAVEEAEPTVRLVSRTKGARLSLARIGSYYWRKVSRQPGVTASFVREHLPPPPAPNVQVAHGSPKVISGQLK